MNESEVQETLKKIQEDYDNITRKHNNDEIDDNEALAGLFKVLGQTIILALETLHSDIVELDTRLNTLEKEVKQLKGGKR